MSRLVLSVLDVARQRTLDITRTVFRHLAGGEEVDPQLVNHKTPLIFGYPNPHAMHAEAGKNKMPAPGTLCRMDIHLGLTKNLREVADVPFLVAFRAIGKAKLQTLDIDRRTAEACTEASIAKFQEHDPQERVMADESHPLGEALSTNLRIGKLIAAGAPAYRLLVRNGGSAFDWSFLVNVSEAIEKNRGRILVDDPLVTDCLTPREAIDRYVQDVVIPEAWVQIEDLVSDGLEIPHHEVLALYTQDGVYIGRVIHHAGLKAVIPKLFYTDEELAAGKVNFFNGRHDQNLGLGRIVHGVGFFATSTNISCVEAVYFSRASAATGLSIKSFSDKPPVEARPLELELLPGLRCGYSSGRWALDGELAVLRKGDRGLFQHSYAPTDTWPSASDFPMLLPLEQELSATAAAGSWPDRFQEKLLLPPEAIEFQQRLSQKLRRDVADARLILEDPAELAPLLRLLLNRVSVEQIESSAERLESSYYDLIKGPDEIKEAGGQRFNTLPLIDQQDRLRLGASFLNTYPFLSQFGPVTHWVIRCGTLGALYYSADTDLPVIVAVLVELALLASTSAAGKPFPDFSFEAKTLAVGRWMDGRTSLEDVWGLASLFTRYQDEADRMEVKVASIRATISEVIDSRERARELGVAYAGERVALRPSGRVRDL